MKRSLRALWILGVIALLAPLGIAPQPARANACFGVVESAECRFGLPAAEYEALLGAMTAHPAPAVVPIGADAAELRRYSLWQLDRKNVTLYDSPGGAPLGTVDPGYTFVVPKTQVEGWMEIEPGKWVSRSNLNGTRASSFTGVRLGALPYPMGWIVRATKPSRAPGLNAVRSTPTLPQYTRVYIYRTEVVGEWEWYLVGPGQWVEQRQMARINPLSDPVSGGRWIGIDLYEQVLIAYEGGTPVFATLVSSGLKQWPTREGTFKVWAKLRTDKMSGSMGRPDQYSIPVVPYVMYFDDDRALHGAFWHNGFGYRRSHGCVNLSVGDARWLYDWASIDTIVHVYSSR